MSAIVEFPAEYGYVLAAASSSFLVNYLHFILTARARKASGLPYPIPYATEEQAKKDPKAFKFNCAQRAHTNFIENHSTFLGSLAITGLRYPMFAASAGALWSFARSIYAIGYTSDAGPKGRVAGSLLAFLSEFGLRFGAVYTSYLFITGQ